MSEIEEILREIDRWYNNLPGGTSRPSLLSKLALLELCGWLESRFDSLVHEIGASVGLNRDWVDKNVVASTFGFSYLKHTRPMLCRLVGESALVHAEETHEADNPGKLEQLKGALTTLSTSRGLLAHTHSAVPGTQQVLYAPSWSLNQHRVISRLIDQYQDSLNKAFRRTIAKPTGV